MRKIVSRLIGATLSLILLVVMIPLKIYAFGEPGASTISAGLGHNVVVKSDGSLWTWGLNYNGELGIGSTESRYSPEKVMDSVTSVSAGDSFTMAIKSDGSLWAWGGNSSGSLGDGTTEDRHTPIMIMDSVIMVSAGGGHTMAIKADGSLWAWGQNAFGQLGDGTTEDRYSPVKIMDSVTMVSAGAAHTAVIKSDGSLWTWGGNISGQLGNDSSQYQSHPAPTKIMDSVVSVSSSSIRTMVIKTDGSTWILIYKPVKVEGLDTSITTMSAESYMVVKSDGSLWGNGSNQFGRLGIGKYQNPQDSNYIKIMDSVAAVSSGDSHFTMALKTDGTLWTWGRGYFGDGTKQDPRDPTDQYVPLKIMDDVMLPNVSNVEKSNPTVNSVFKPELKITDIRIGVKLEWTPSLDAKGYRVYRSTAEGEKGEIICDNLMATDFIDPNVDSNTTYFYSVYKLSMDEDGNLVEGEILCKTEKITTQTIDKGSERPKGFILMKIGKDTMLANDKEVEIDPGRGTSPILLNGRTLMPIRAVIEAMGGKADWNENEKTVTLSVNNNNVKMTIDRHEISVNGNNKSMDVPPQIINERTMLPVRFVAENIGCQIEWIGSTQEIVIVFDKQ